MWSGLRSDLTLAARRVAQAPGFAFACVLTLALGIGGNTAVFTLIDRVMLKPLPVPRPSELYRLGDTADCCVNSGLAGSFSLFSYDLYTHLRDGAPQFSHLAAFQANTRPVTIGRVDTDVPPETMNGAFVSGNYFQMFELAPEAGRLIQPSDDRTGAAPVAVISHHAWTRRYAARGDVVGGAVTLNGVPATIVGVAPRGFYGDTLRPDPAEIWIPIASEPLLQPAARLVEAKPAHWLYAIGRLKPGVAIAPLQAQLTAALQHWIASTLDLSAEERSRIPQQHINVISAAGGVRNLRNRVAPSLELLQALAAAVLLIACATTGAVQGLEAQVRRGLAEVDRRITVRTLIPMDEQVSRAFNIERLIARLTVAFGLVALLLACLGLYGVTAYSVSRRTREIGIRMAVGASRPRVLRTILRGALVQLLIGVAIGLPAVFVTGRLLQARLFDVSQRDPLVLGGALVLLALAAVIAAGLPASRAAAMDPAKALRME